MSSEGNPLDLSVHWHVDCRLVAELPEDSVVGTRFLINAGIGTATVAILLGTIWLAYVNLATRETIRDWEHRIADRRSEITEVENLQLAFNRESTAIDAAYDLIHSPLVLTDFVQQVGRARPDLMVIDLIERSSNILILRGSLRESSERASRLLGAYVQQLKDNPAASAPFQDIVLTSIERISESDQIRFEITFRFKPEGRP